MKPFILFLIVIGAVTISDVSYQLNQLNCSDRSSLISLFCNRF